MENRVLGFLPLLLVAVMDAIVAPGANIALVAVMALVAIVAMVAVVALVAVIRLAKFSVCDDVW